MSKAPRLRKKKKKRRAASFAWWRSPATVQADVDEKPAYASWINSVCFSPKEATQHEPQEAAAEAVHDASSQAYAHELEFLPCEGGSLAAEMLGVHGAYLRRLGLLRVLAMLNTFAMRSGFRPVPSLKICQAAGAEDARSRFCVRNMLTVAASLGLVDVEKIKINYGLYQISDKGLDELEHASQPLAASGWAFRRNRQSP